MVSISRSFSVDGLPGLESVKGGRLITEIGLICFSEYYYQTYMDQMQDTI